jgi:hypothetical protein
MGSLKNIFFRRHGIQHLIGTGNDSWKLPSLLLLAFYHRLQDRRMVRAKIDEAMGDPCLELSWKLAWLKACSIHMDALVLTSQRASKKANEAV